MVDLGGLVRPVLLPQRTGALDRVEVERRLRRHERRLSSRPPDHRRYVDSHDRAAPPTLACLLVAGLLPSRRRGPADRADQTAILGTRLVGYSVQHRTIVAYHLGDPACARPVMVLLGQMHGDEHAGVVVASSMHQRYASRLQGVNLWVIPTMNPDGDAAHTRQNAHHVDLNRNWPDHWRPPDRPVLLRAARRCPSPRRGRVRRFLLTCTRAIVASLHQPLNGVDSTGSGTADRQGSATRSRAISGLPIKAFDCWSVCYGSLSSWFHARKIGNAVETVEFGPHPARTYLTARVRARDHRRDGRPLRKSLAPAWYW